MARAYREIELAVRIGKSGGGLSHVLATVAAAGVNVLAYCAYSDWTGSVVLLVTQNAGAALRALTAAGFDCKANSVVLVGAPDRVGAAAQLGARLGAAGVEILYSYASSTGGDQFFAVFKTSDDDRAIQVLQAEAVARAA